jgi:hypothetical protein
MKISSNFFTSLNCGIIWIHTVDQAQGNIIMFYIPFLQKQLYDKVLITEI